MTLNCLCPIAIQLMRDPGFIDEQSNADYLDALADIDDELREAMQESDQCDWYGVEEISDAERNALDVFSHYNERYVIHDTYTHL